MGCVGVVAVGSGGDVPSLDRISLFRFFAISLIFVVAAPCLTRSIGTRTERGRIDVLLVLFLVFR